jgi:hypothetical protein
MVQAVQAMLKNRQVYEGVYTIGMNQQGYGLYATARLINSAGGQATAIDPVNAVDIDSLPPQAPTRTVAESLDTRIRVQWAPNSDADLIGYEVWTSTTPLSGYQLAMKTEHPEATLAAQTNFSRIYFKVRAVDKALNASGFSEPMAAMALPAPDLKNLPRPGPGLGGDLASKVLLLAEKNPYTISTTLRVVEGGMLAIGPGVQMSFAPGASLEVDGGDLMAYGNRQQFIYLGARAGNGHAGRWPGVVLKNTAQSVLQYVIISNAVTGLMVFSSTPHIDHVTVKKTSQAGLVLGNQARPTITCCVISENGGQGGMVLEGEGLAPVFERNVFDNNDPFHVQNYSPTRIDMTRQYWGAAAPSPGWFLGDIVWRPFLRNPPTSCRGKTE